jgi:glycosyltransferase involved in cell wall biosynthesis
MTEPASARIAAQREPSPATAPGLRRAEIAGRPLRILLATARYVPDRGGTAIHTHEIAHRLAAHGGEVTVASTVRSRHFSPESREGPVRVLQVRAWPSGRDYFFAPGLVRVIRASTDDLLHCQGYHTLVAPLVMLAALMAKLPYVVTLHSGGHSSRVRRALRPAQALALRPLLRRARQLIAVSQFEAELFARRTRLPLSSFLVIPSGVDLPTTGSEEPASSPPLILSIGRLESYKGHHRVVEALPALTRARPGTRLRVVGSGPYESELRRLADRLDVSHLIDIEPVPAERRDEMARLLRSAGCVALLSEYESQGLATQEALALGRPLVLSDSSALAEIRQHANVHPVSRHASADEIASAIVAALDAPSVAPPSLPTWDDCATALLDIYLEVMRTSR